MRSAILLAALVFCFVIHAQNLIQNPGFEVGAIPTGPDQVAFATGWSRNCGRYYASMVPNGNPGSPDLFDQRSTDCMYQVPTNKWGVRPTRSGGYRYVGFSGQSNTNGPAYYGETVEAVLTAPLNSSPYEISFWASAVDGIKYQCSQAISAVPPDSNNKIEVVLRKGSNCSTGKSVYVSTPITAKAWQLYSGQFTLSATEVAAGYDRIEFRLTQIAPTYGNTFHIVYVDDVSLQAAAKGMTWSLLATNSTTGTVRVGCGTTCDPRKRKGDTVCTQPLPLLCIKKSGVGFPLALPTNVNDTDQYNRWSGGIVGTTAAILPPPTLAATNAVCVQNFGADWRVAEFHDGMGWSFQAYGGVGIPASRFWVHINDQPGGTCWH
jgi:hypothetical protein